MVELLIMVAVPYRHISSGRLHCLNITYNKRSEKFMYGRIAPILPVLFRFMVLSFYRPPNTRLLSLTTHLTKSNRFSGLIQVFLDTLFCFSH